MRLRFAGLIVALLCPALPVQAQECGPLTRAISLDLETGPAGLRYSVPVTVNGRPKRFLLSTGDWASRLGRETVTELKLSSRESNVRMLSSSGTGRNASLVIADLGIGPMKAPGHELLVMEQSGPLDGLLGTDLMQNYDIELDFGGRKLNYFLTDHCAGRVVYWTTTGFTSVDFTGWDSNSNRRAITIPVEIDGHQVYAELFTGLPETILDAAAASALFNLTPDSQGAVPLGALDGNPAHRVFGWTFKSLKIGGLTITNPKMRVEPDLIGTKDEVMLQADSKIRRRTDNFFPTLRIGMDVMKRLHLYVAAKERKLYITAAAEAPEQAPAGRGRGGRGRGRGAPDTGN